MRKILTNLFWLLVGTAHFWWQWVWSKLRWFLDAIALARLPEDVEHLFGPVSMSGPSLIVLAIALVGLYLTNRDFWHSLFSKRTPGIVALNDTTTSGTKLIALGQSIILGAAIVAMVGILIGVSLIIIGDMQNTKQRSEAHNATREPTAAPIVQSTPTTPGPSPIAEVTPIPSPAAPIIEAPIAPPPAITPEPSIPKVPSKPPRQFVDPHVTPEFLLGLYDGNTILRAETLISEQKGKWMPVSGPLGDVHPGQIIFGDRTPTLVVFAHPRQATVYMWFSGEWVDRLSHLPKNQNISVIGQIKTVTSYNTTVQLENCELVDSDPLTNVPTQSPNSPVRPRRRRRPSRG